MKLNNKGFSLVELMVVVAIIGILASVAIPSVNKYMAKARQSEAKTNLGSLYTAEKAFFAEYNVYDSRFSAIGFAPEGKLRYNVGFGAAGFQAGAGHGYTATPSTSHVSANAYCGAAGAFVRGCTMLNGATNAAPPAINAASVTAANTFVAEAQAVISSTIGAADIWQINEVKSLNNTASGID